MEEENKHINPLEDKIVTSISSSNEESKDEQSGILENETSLKTEKTDNTFNGNNSVDFFGFNLKFLTDNKFAYLLLLLLLGITYYVRSNFFLIPFERDEGIYAYFGKLILEGKIPYKDFYEIKLPGIFYAYALIVKVFGYSVYKLHFGFTIVNLLNIIILFFIGKKILGPFYGLAIGVVFSILSLNPGLCGFTIQSEHLVVFFISAGILALIYANDLKKQFYYLLSGLLFALAVSIKSHAVFMCFFGLLMIIVNNYSNEKAIISRILLKNILYYLIGGFIIIILISLSILLNNSYKEFSLHVLHIGGTYEASVSFEFGWQNFTNSLSRILENHKVFWYLSMFSVFTIFSNQFTIKEKIFCIQIMLLSFLMILPGFYFYGHYYILILPAVSILSGISLKFFKLYFEKKIEKFASIFVSITFIILSYSHVSSLNSYYFQPDYFKILRSTYGINPFPEAMEIGKWLNTKLKNEDKITLIGSEPQLYVYTNKNSISRHAYFTAVVIDFPEHKIWQREFTSDIKTNKPRFIIYFNNPLSLLIQKNTDKYIFKWVADYIKQNYKVAGLVEMVSPNESRYIFGEKVNKYNTPNKNLIYIYERNKN
jgi:hypothetical protein